MYIYASSMHETLVFSINSTETIDLYYVFIYNNKKVFFNANFAKLSGSIAKHISPSVINRGFFILLPIFIKGDVKNAYYRNS